MPWARFEDRYPANRKVRPLSDVAFRLDVTGVCWSSEQLTDGHITDLADLIGIKRPEKAVAELVRRGRWHEPGHTCPHVNCRPITTGWLIHDYQDFNPNREKVIAEREAKAKRQARWLASRRGGKATRDPSPDASKDASATPLETVTPPRPAPKEGGGGSPRSAGGGRRPAGPPPPAVFEGWCGNCSDPDRRLTISPESGNVTRTPCADCHPSVRAS